MNTQLVKRTIIALAVSAVTATGTAGVAAATPEAPQRTSMTQQQAGQDRWAVELVSTFVKRYSTALQEKNNQQKAHLLDSYFLKHGELILEEVQAMDGRDPIFKDFGLPSSGTFRITATSEAVISVEYTARTADRKTHTWNFQVDQDSALIKMVRLA